MSLRDKYYMSLSFAKEFRTYFYSSWMPLKVFKEGDDMRSFLCPLSLFQLL